MRSARRYAQISPTAEISACVTAGAYFCQRQLTSTTGTAPSGTTLASQ